MHSHAAVRIDRGDPAGPSPPLPQGWPRAERPGDGRGTWATPAEPALFRKEPACFPSPLTLCHRGAPLTQSTDPGTHTPSRKPAAPAPADSPPQGLPLLCLLVRRTFDIPPKPASTASRLHAWGHGVGRGGAARGPGTVTHAAAEAGQPSRPHPCCCGQPASTVRSAGAPGATGWGGTQGRVQRGSLRRWGPRTLLRSTERSRGEAGGRGRRAGTQVRRGAVSVGRHGRASLTC